MSPVGYLNLSLCFCGALSVILSCITNLRGKYWPPNNHRIEIPPPPPTRCQRSKDVLPYPGPSPLPIHAKQEADLHKTIKACQLLLTQVERCQHAHKEEPFTA